MKRIGVLGGIGPQSTAYFYKAMYDYVQINYDSVYPNIIINSINVWDVISKMESRSEQITFLTQEIKKIEELCDFIVCPCNTVHAYYDEIITQLHIPWYPIYDAVQEVLLHDNRKKIGLLGTKMTSLSGMYSLLEKNNVTYELPSLEDIDGLNDIILKKLFRGQGDRELRDILIRLSDELVKRGCDSILLACTELPLFINQKDISIPLYSTADILAQKTIDTAFKH